MEKTKNTAEELKIEAQKEQKQKDKKQNDLSNVKYALELGLKKGAFSSLEEMASIINSFDGLK
tara:strand:+ start:404 stop:592 length:189 start_codon:yes stop_codon:yes gene_type:complete